MSVIPNSSVKYIRAVGWVARIEFHVRVGTPEVGTYVDGQRLGRWRVKRVLREGGLLLGAVVEAERS